MVLSCRYCGKNDFPHFRALLEHYWEKHAELKKRYKVTKRGVGVALVYATTIDEAVYASGWDKGDCKIKEVKDEPISHKVSRNRQHAGGQASRRPVPIPSSPVKTSNILNGCKAIKDDPMRCKHCGGVVFTDEDGLCCINCSRGHNANGELKEIYYGRKGNSKAISRHQISRSKPTTISTQR